jgi:GNAT superfamily N-acetyltransferase
MPDELAIRPLSTADIDAVTAIDRAVVGRSRRAFFEKRLAHFARDPQAFIALAADLGGKPVGFAFARLYEGEFGGADLVAALDAIGVDVAARGHGTGRRLIDAVAEAMRARGARELTTEVDWSETDLLAFFNHTTFTLAPRIVLERAVEPVAL